jgi:hypothetical protein
MLEDLPDDLALRDGGDDPQRPLLTTRAARHIQRKDALAAAAPNSSAATPCGRLWSSTPAGGRGDDRPTQVTVRRQTAAIAHQCDAGQGHEGGQLLQEFHGESRMPVVPSTTDG